MTSTARQRAWLPLALSLCALVVAGCAGLRLPRIDPTGERVLVWPQDQVPAVPLSSGNPVAPPVLTDPVFPQPGLPVAAALPPLPQDRISITPNRVLAPVGSEVVLKAGVCTPENYLLADTKTEWLIARESAGEFVALGGRGWLRDPLLPWNKPKKIDNQFATGYSAKVPLTITRGTADITDDVQVERGEAWATITSPVEGTTHVTAVAPEIVAWSGRRATATIYWVDVQWTFPPATVSAGRSQALTTTVRRQSDGTPIEGWLVRYEVDGGTGTLTGNPSGQVVEVPTDVHGQASIDVSPTGTTGSASRINMQIVRPSRYAGSDMPRLVIATGASTIQWTDTRTPYLPPADNVGATPLPVPTPTPADVVPPVAPRSALVVEIRGPFQEAQVGGQARFEVVIHNRGTATATGVVVRDQFDVGLSHLEDPNRYQQIKMPLGDIAPGDSRTVNPNFNVQKAGELCHTVFVSSREADEVQATKCFLARQPPSQKQAGIEVNKTGPEQKVVGQMALFTVTVKNTGEVPLTNIQIRDEYDPALVPRPTGSDYTLDRGAIVRNIPRLEVNDSRQFDVQCECAAAKPRACSTVHVSADPGGGAGRIPSSDQKCIEILPPTAVVPPLSVLPQNPKGNLPFDDVMPGTTAGRAGLRLDLRSVVENPIRAGTFPKFEIVLQNNSAAGDDQVNLAVQFPPGIVPDPTTVVTNAGVRANLKGGNELRFDAIAQIRPDERLWFTVNAKVNQTGFGDITAKASSRTLRQPIEKTIRVEAIR